jgi:hypothetical protein
MRIENGRRSQCGGFTGVCSGSRRQGAETRKGRFVLKLDHKKTASHGREKAARHNGTVSGVESADEAFSSRQSAKLDPQIHRRMLVKNRREFFPKLSLRVF